MYSPVWKAESTSEQGEVFFLVFHLILTFFRIFQIRLTFEAGLFGCFLDQLLDNIYFIDFWNPLYFRVQKGGLGGSTSQYLSDLKFMFLETGREGEWDQGDC